MVQSPVKPQSTSVLDDRSSEQRVHDIFCPPQKTFRLKAVDFKDLKRRSRLRIPEGFPQPLFGFGDIINASGQVVDITGKPSFRTYSGIVCGLRFHPAASHDMPPDWEYYLCELPGVKTNVSSRVADYPTAYFSVHERQLERMTSLYVRTKPLPRNFLRTIKFCWNRIWEKNRNRKNFS